MTDETNLSEEDIFAAASADTVEEPSTEPAQAAAPPQTSTDAEPDDPQEPAASEPTQDHRVPVRELQEERRKRKEIEQQLTELRQQAARLEGFVQASQPRPQPQPQPQAPDFFEDPAGFVRQAVEPLQQGQQAMKEQFSEMLAVQAFGEEKVETAFKAMEQAVRSDPSAQYDYQRILAAKHPYAELVKWHDRRQALAEIGEDPAAYRERLRAELMAEMQGQPAAPAAAAAPATTTRNPASIPSLTRATGSPGSTEAMITERDIFNAAPGFRSRR